MDYYGWLFRLFSDQYKWKLNSSPLPVVRHVPRVAPLLTRIKDFPPIYTELLYSLVASLCMCEGFSGIMGVPEVLQVTLWVCQDLTQYGQHIILVISLKGQMRESLMTTKNNTEVPIGVHWESIFEAREMTRKVKSCISTYMGTKGHNRFKRWELFSYFSPPVRCGQETLYMKKVHNLIF